MNVIVSAYTRKAKAANSGGDDIDEIKLINNNIVGHLKILKELLDKVRQYFLAKIKKVTLRQSNSDKNEEKKFVTPLFGDMNHPKQDQVGILLPLKCGHNGRPTDRETINLEMHLEASGFFI